MAYETPVEIQVAGYDLEFTIVHDGVFPSAYILPSGDRIEWREVAAPVRPLSCEDNERHHIFFALNNAVERRFGDRLQHLEYERHDRAVDHADQETRRQREAA